MQLPPKGPGDLGRRLSPQLLLNRPAASPWKKEKVRREKKTRDRTRDQEKQRILSSKAIP